MILVKVIGNWKKRNFSQKLGFPVIVVRSVLQQMRQVPGKFTIKSWFYCYDLFLNFVVIIIWKKGIWKFVR